ncbi:KAP family P-loop NTPase fold protein [Thalassotalea montiporae]
MKEQKHQFDWDSPIDFSLSAGSSNEEVMPSDALERNKYAEYLTSYIASLGERNYVLNLDSDWGTGKTYFLKRWYMSIQRQYPCIYVDVWKHDYSDDPLLTLISALESQFSTLRGHKESSTAYKSVGNFLKGVAPHIAKAMVYKATGVKLDELDEGLENTDRKNLAEVAGAATKQLIDQHNEQSRAIDEFKLLITASVSALVQQDNKEYRYPLYIFIDELDRCRPTFAVELLEVVKHLFDIPNVVFVIGSDTEQLQSAIKVLYGSEFDSRQYLTRFFHRRFTLPEPSVRHFLNVCQTVGNDRLEYLYDRNLWPVIKEGLNKVNDFRDVCSAILTAFQMKLRDSELVMDRLMSSIISASRAQPINWIYLLLLFCLNHKFPFHYKLFKEGKLTRISPDGSIDSTHREHLRSLQKELKHSEFVFFIHVDQYSNTDSDSIEVNVSQIIEWSYMIYFDSEFERSLEEDIHSISVKSRMYISLSKFQKEHKERRTNYFNMVEVADLFD